MPTKINCLRACFFRGELVEGEDTSDDISIPVATNDTNNTNDNNDSNDSNPSRPACGNAARLVFFYLCTLGMITMCMIHVEHAESLFPWEPSWLRTAAPFLFALIDTILGFCLFCWCKPDPLKDVEKKLREVEKKLRKQVNRLQKTEKKLQKQVNRLQKTSNDLHTEVGELQTTNKKINETLLTWNENFEEMVSTSKDAITGTAEQGTTIMQRMADQLMSVWGEGLKNLAKDSALLLLHGAIDKVAKIKELFDAMDTDKNGQLSFQEIAAFFERLGCDHVSARVKAAGFKYHLDEDHDDMVSLQEMLDFFELNEYVVQDDERTEGSTSEVNGPADLPQAAGFDGPDVDPALPLFNAQLHQRALNAGVREETM